MNAIGKQAVMMVVCLATWSTMVSQTFGDPLPGRDTLKFSQLPMNGVTIPFAGAVQRYWGHDELSTAYSTVTATGQTAYRGTFMADDFADKFSTPIVHVKWWGSYLNNFIDPGLPVDKFLISVESDVPAGPAGNFSHPGTPLLNQIVRRGPLAPGSGTFTETAIGPGGPPLAETLYEYNAELHLGKEFFQKPDTVYWLKIVALVDVPPALNIDPINPPTFVPRWGWHNRDYTVTDPLASTAPAVVPGEQIAGFLGPAPGGVPVWHFQDDAVTGVVNIDTSQTPMGSIMPVVTQANFQPRRYVAGADGPQLIVEFSKDLAFQLFTTAIPEPASCAMLLIGLALLSVPRRRRRRS